MPQTAQAYKIEFKSLKNYCVIDTETTGLFPRKADAEIIQLGAVKVRNNEIADKFEVFVKPQTMPKQDTIKIHHITPEMLKNEKPFAEVYSKFNDFIGNDDLLGYNIFFDIGIIKEECYRSEMPSHLGNNQKYDVMGLTKGKLKTNLKKYKIAKSQQHNALSDCENTHKLFQVLKKKAK
jgi:DNA polymerase III epsilon subunit family exonuclease